MTVPTDDRRKIYTGDDVTTVFNGPMAYSATHIFAALVDTVTGVVSTAGAFTVSQLGKSAGTRVVMTVAPPSGYQLVLLRTLPYSQNVDITNQGSFNASVLEQGMDLLDMQIQQLADDVGRTPKLGEADIDGNGVYDGNGNRMGNVADAVNPTDVPNLGQVSGLISIPTGPFLQSGTGAEPRSMQDKERDIINALDFKKPTDLDGTAMIQRALVEVASRDGGQINLPPGEIVISSTLSITNGVRIVGRGARFGSASDGTTLLWGGAAGGTMISVSGSIEGVYLEGIGIDGANLANVCVTMNRMRISQFNSLRIRNYRQYGLRLYAEGTAGPNDGIQFNTFQNIYMESSYAGSIGIYLHGNGFTGNPCHNVWSNIGITHVNYAVYLDDCDNNCFVQLYCNSNGTTTHDIYLAGALTRSNYFYHLQGRPLAKALSNNAIFGYDMDNGQPYPDIEATAQLQVIGNSANFPYWNMNRPLNGLLARIPASDPPFGQTGVNAGYTGLERPDLGAQLLWGVRNSPRQIEGYATTDGTANPLWLILDNFGVQKMMVGGQFITTALAKPTTGSYTVGDYVLNRAPAVLPMGAGNYTILGWRRLTTGSGHVLNTDWVEMRCLTGT